MHVASLVQAISNAGRPGRAAIMRETNKLPDAPEKLSTGQL
jgi:hypothetical protein